MDKEDVLIFCYAGYRRAIRGEWFKGSLGGLFPWNWDEPSLKKHHVYTLRGEFRD
jgi:hypothetical protein